MPKLSFKFEGKANERGIIEVLNSVNVPFGVKIKSVEIRTTSNCNTRTHKTSLVINTDEWLSNSSITDCTSFKYEEEKWVEKGKTKVYFSTDNFAANEIVKGEGVVEYNFWKEAKNTFKYKENKIVLI